MPDTVPFSDREKLFCSVSDFLHIAYIQEALQKKTVLQTWGCLFTGIKFSKIQTLTF